MQAKELFGVVVRTLGLVIALYGVWYLAYAIARALRAVSRGRYPVTDWLFAGLLYILIGGSVFIGADAIVRIAYR